MFNKIKTLTAMCPICEATKKLHYGINKETLNVRGENIDVDVKTYYCPDGDHFFSNLEFDEEKFQTAYREFRNRRKIIQPEEIKEIRNKYGLTQDELSHFLGYGKKTIARYETGAIPDDGHNNLIRLIQEPDNFMKHFVNYQHRLPNKLKKKIEKSLQKLGLLETHSAFISNNTSIANAFTYFADAITYSKLCNVIPSAFSEEPSEELNFQSCNIKLVGDTIPDKTKPDNHGGLALAA